jgi:hypothetical protein
MNSDPNGSAPESNYVMGRTSDEYERLRRQAKLLEPITRSVLERTGLSTGMSCLGLGCGPAEVMRLMAGVVAPAGRKLGSTNQYVLSPSLVSAWKQKPAQGL